jgi:hypothetical protein
MVEERDLDWVDMRSRCKRLLDRTEKAARLMQPDNPTEQPIIEADPVNHGGRLLTPRQVQIQQKILQARSK